VSRYTGGRPIASGRYFGELVIPALEVLDVVFGDLSLVQYGSETSRIVTGPPFGGFRDSSAGIDSRGSSVTGCDRGACACGNGGQRPEG